MGQKRKMILYVAMSLDGYIAATDDSLDFLSVVQEAGEDYGYADFVKSVDTVIVGRKTYEKVVSMGYDYPHTDKDVYIITRAERPSIGTLRFHTGDLAELVSYLKSRPGKHIYCDGGAEIANQLLKHQLIEEFIISVIPILLGGGVRLFQGGFSEQNLKLLSCQSFSKGLAQLHYQVKWD
jgi:dihydrofolate reductase